MVPLSAEACTDTTLVMKYRKLISRTLSTKVLLFILAVLRV
jgi:hypothetical protein